MKGAVLQWYSTFFERRNHRMSTKGKKGWIIAFVLPCVVLFCLVYAIPFIMVITTSFCNYTLTQAPAFQGLEPASDLDLALVPDSGLVPDLDSDLDLVLDSVSHFLCSEQTLL